MQDQHADETQVEQRCEDCGCPDFYNKRDDDGYLVLWCEDCHAYIREITE